jgi:hypothetical protein
MVRGIRVSQYVGLVHDPHHVPLAPCRLGHEHRGEHNDLMLGLAPVFVGIVGAAHS